MGRVSRWFGDLSRLRGGYRADLSLCLADPFIDFRHLPVFEAVHTLGASGCWIGGRDGALGRMGRRDTIAASDLARVLAHALYLLLGFRVRHYFLDDGRDV